MFAGILKLRRLNIESVGIDIAESAVHSISHLSNLAGQRVLKSNLRIGTFSPNNSRLYAVLNEGNIGGLTTVYRSRAGIGSANYNTTDASDVHYNCNAHLIDGGQKSRFLGYYDANSLYPSSGELFCPAHLVVRVGKGSGRAIGRAPIPELV